MSSVASGLQQVYDYLRRAQPLEAAQALAPLLREHPREPAVHRAHAAVAQSSGRPEAALSAMCDALDLAPAVPELHLEYGQVLASAGRVDEAIASFRRTVELRPDFVEAWYLLGMTLYGARRDAEALAPLRRAHALAPGHPQIARALAETEYALEHHDQALTLFESLVKPPAPADALLCLRRSQCRRRLAAAAEALVVVNEALERFAGDPLLWQELGWVQEDLGDATAARAAYVRAHELSPEWADPLGSIIALDRSAAPTALAQRAEALAAVEGAAEQQRAFLHHALGKRRDALGEYVDAARHWTEANRLRRALDGAFDRERFAAQVDAAIAVFDAETLATLHRAAVRDERPLFVVGMPRSGTTLVEQILAAHPRGHGCGELAGVVSIADGIAESTGLGWPQDAGHVAPAWRIERARSYLDVAARGAPVDALRLVDKQPYNFLHIGLIAMLFADARIVWCRRDPRDVALSIYSESFSPQSSFATDLDDIAFVIAQQERLMRHWRAVSPLPILEFDYETIVVDSETQIRRLIDFAGLPWHEACLRFHESGRVVQTLSRWQVRQPLHPRSVGRWRNYPQWFGDD